MFVEVWRLAPVSDARRDDVLVWITGIAARRAGEKLREIDHHSSAVGTDCDGHFDRELAAGFGTEQSTLWSPPPGTQGTGGSRP
ncbi:hypothetical protein ABNF97_32730 [Plantactinospora sp. B6F1]|uniref:hypothetical protein n=1 Tax=Plantactinospora sp. B6F1 TaxID=3158971 RepID=UPI0032D95CBA